MGQIDRKKWLDLWVALNGIACNQNLEQSRKYRRERHMENITISQWFSIFWSCPPFKPPAVPVCPNPPGRCTPNFESHSCIQKLTVSLELVHKKNKPRGGPERNLVLYTACSTHCIEGQLKWTSSAKTIILTKTAIDFSSVSLDQILFSVNGLITSS